MLSIVLLKLNSIFVNKIPTITTTTIIIIAEFLKTFLKKAQNVCIYRNLTIAGFWWLR